MILGVDPGLKGGLCLFDSVAGSLVVMDMPVVTITKGKKTKNEVSAPLVAAALRDFASKIDRAFIERVGAMPGQGVTSMFSFGRSVGTVEGVLAALAVPVYYVTPQTWQAFVRIKGKEESRARAAQLFPAFADQFARAKDDGRADAALIAWFGECQ